ncbi:hypothetical protein B0H14DRAFT_3574874 [Mycena olivaceomarginata]|nr:hypothetical protein B0H14DRAFT_3574874 [Mycena olivaceomarginata]
MTLILCNSLELKDKIVTDPTKAIVHTRCKDESDGFTFYLLPAFPEPSWYIATSGRREYEVYFEILSQKPPKFSTERNLGLTDLVPASSSDSNSTNECGDDSAMRSVTTVACTTTHDSNMGVVRARHASYGYPRMASHGVQTAGPTPDHSWRAPPYLAQRAFREAFADQPRPRGFNYGHMGNHFRRGGAPYTSHAVRAVNPDVIHDLAMCLQHIERAVYALEQHWLPRHF